MQFGYKRAAEERINRIAMLLESTLKIHMARRGLDPEFELQDTTRMKYSMYCRHLPAHVSKCESKADCN